jgi:predicted component of type VI protein secretion system
VKGPISSSPTSSLSLASLKDFHPDTLYKNVAVFGQLRDLRRSLNNPASFNQAVEEMGGFQKQEQDLAFQEPVVETDLKPQVAEVPVEQTSAVSFLDSIMQRD